MDLSIVGRHALFFDDDANVLFVNSPEALVPWSENPSLLIDRYDVRHLLQRIPPPPKKNGRRQEHVGDGVSRSDLDRERYLDLPLLDDDKKETRKDADGMKASTGDYQAVPFLYSNSNDDSVQKDTDVAPAYSGYQPPFSLPQGLLNNLPPTEKMHQIIARTVTFVIKNGVQSEIVLRVKQGGNPTFGFLMPDHHLHPYFRYLVDHPEFVNKVDNVIDKQEKIEAGSEERSPITEGGALSLLGSVYGLEEDEEDDTHGCSEPSEPKETKTSDSADDVIHKPENGTSSIVNDMEVKTSLKPKAVSISTEKMTSQKKNLPVISLPSDDASVNKSVKTSSSDVSSGKQWLNLPDTSQIVLEPLPALKKMVDKIVEFIVKNGKEFETILIEQDRSHGRFPFLLPSNIYHSYYLKVLHEAQETKLLGKSRKDEPFDKADSLRRNRGSKGDNASLQDSSSKQMEGSYDSSDRRDKIKMVIGGLKKEANELPPSSGSKPSSGIGTDVAAAIVTKATRGLSSQTNSVYPTINKQSGMSTEAAAAIVMQATRHSSSPRISDLSGSPLLFDGEGYNRSNNLTLTNIFAKTAAMAAASEADSSEASLTREEQKKAERLKRAKMLAAMLNKPNDYSKATLLPTAIGSGSAHSGSFPDFVRRERVGSSSIMPADSITAMPAKGEEHLPRKRHNDEDFEEKVHKKKKHRSSHSHRKRHHSNSNYDIDGSDDDQCWEKKTKSRHHHHHRRHRHHRRTGSSSEDDNSPPEQQKSRSKTTKDESKADGQLSGNTTTEVPDDLRAKVRAMLLATM